MRRLLACMRVTVVPRRSKAAENAATDRTPLHEKILLMGIKGLLKHLALRSQYLRITLNKSRPSSKNQSYRSSMLMLLTAHPEGKV